MPAPAGRAAPALAVEPAMLILAYLLHLPHSGAASLPAAPDRPLPATPAVGPLSSESTVHTLQRLWLCLTPAETVPVCLWWPTSHASARLSQTECTAWTLRQFNCHCHFSSPTCPLLRLRRGLSWDRLSLASWACRAGGFVAILSHQGASALRMDRALASRKRQGCAFRGAR